MKANSGERKRVTVCLIQAALKVTAVSVIHVGPMKSVLFPKFHFFYLNCSGLIKSLNKFKFFEM